MRDPGCQKMTRRPRPRLALVKRSPVLITESADEFGVLHDTLRDDYKPHGPIDEFKVEEIAALIWENRRYRRAKTVIINSAYRQALKNLLERVCREPGESISDTEIEEDTEELAHQWFGNDQNAKQRILEALAHFGLDEHAIEAEAMRIRAAELEQFDRLLASIEWRLDKALRSFAEWRGVLERSLRETADRVIEGDVVALNKASKNPSPRTGMTRGHRSTNCCQPSQRTAQHWAAFGRWSETVQSEFPAPWSCRRQDCNRGTHRGYRTIGPQDRRCRH